MSDFDFIAWSLAVAGAAGLTLAILAALSRRYDWADRGARLQRRLDTRLARGTDRYFEELRSIKSQIELHERSKTPTVPRFVLLHTLLTIGFVILLGPMLMNSFGHSIFGVEPPAWTNNFASIWIPIFGAQRLLDSFSANPDNPLADRVIGGLMLGVGILIILTSFFH